MLIYAVSPSQNVSSVASRRQLRTLPGLRRQIRLAIVLFALILPASFAQAIENQRTAQTILHLLDYLSVDYGGAVLLERVVNESEYREQVEFSKQSVKLLGELPDHPGRDTLIEQARVLVGMVRAKVPAELVSASAQQLRRDLIDVYQVPVVPGQNPDLISAAILYQKNCAKCHGTAGYGDGPESKTLTPKPADFHNMGRMGQRSVYGLYNTITLGVKGTAMQAHPELSDEERWSLAFFVSNFRNSAEYIEQGRKLWEQRAYRGPAPDLAALTTLTSNDVVLRHGDQTRAVYAYLRANPQAMGIQRHSTLLFATEQLDQASARYRDGDRIKALRIAIAAYLEGFEPIEISIDNLDLQLRRDIEREMMEVRQLIDSGAPVEAVAEKIEQTKRLLRKADELLRAGKLSVAGAFVSALFVLLREGIEGMLVLAALIAFVVKSGRREALVYIHAGWGSALLFGVFTWVAATWLVEISGAEREVTEGVTALIASVMLVYVGFWLHDKAHAQSWEKFLQGQVVTALERKPIWALALVAFFAVYREIFETVLFYQALWAQVNDTTRPALWSGMMTGALLLITIGWVLFRFSIKLPLGAFFSGISLLLGIMAVIFAGQGVAALQEASIIPASHVDFISMPLLGIHPTVQTLLAQAAVIAILALCYRIPLRRQPV